MKKKKRKKYGKPTPPEETLLNGLDADGLEEDDEADEIFEDEAFEYEGADEADSKGEDAEITDSHEKLYKETLDRYQRTLAEFDNFRKRTIKEKAARYDDGMRAAAEKLLPLVDNFERALLAGPGEDSAEGSFYQGIALIARQFTQVLQDLHVEAIPAQPGDEFDTAVHYAVAHVEDDDFGASQVAEVLQKGYKYKDKVLRYSMVKVAN